MSKLLVLSGVAYAVMFAGLLDDVHHRRHAMPLQWLLFGGIVGAAVVGGVCLWE